MKRFTYDYEIDNEIAKALGWTDLKEHCPSSLCPLYHGVIPKQPGIPWTSTPQLVPRFSQDLNAMHEAEKLLTDEQWFRYRAELWNITPRSFALPDCERATIHATARQRAEAFLRTLNLWPE
jgi:hypothetical protein